MTLSSHQQMDGLLGLGVALLALSCTGGDDGHDSGGVADDSATDDSGFPEGPDWSAVAARLTDFGGLEVWADGKPAGPVGFWAYDANRTVGVWSLLNLAPEEAPSNGGVGSFEASVALGYHYEGKDAGVFAIWGDDLPLPCEKLGDGWLDFMVGMQGTAFLTLDGSGSGSMRFADVLLTDLKEGGETLEDVASPELTFVRCDSILF